MGAIRRRSMRLKSDSVEADGPRLLIPDARLPVQPPPPLASHSDYRYCWQTFEYSQALNSHVLRPAKRKLQARAA
jgi:hypothetical protein